MELLPGFENPVRDAAVAFRAILDAMARPGRVNGLPVIPEAPAGLNAGAAVVVLSLLDGDTPVWISPSIRSEALEGYLRFHTGASIVSDPEAARFALFPASEAAEVLERLPIGTPEYPDRSATAILLVDGLNTAQGKVLTGPGIEGSARLSVTGMTAGGWEALSRNAALYPLGIDSVFAAPDSLAALPRSTTISE